MKSCSILVACKVPNFWPKFVPRLCFVTCFTQFSHSHAPISKVCRLNLWVVEGAVLNLSERVYLTLVRIGNYWVSVVTVCQHAARPRDHHILTLQWSKRDVDIFHHWGKDVNPRTGRKVHRFDCRTSSSYRERGRWFEQVTCSVKFLLHRCAV